MPAVGGLYSGSGLEGASCDATAVATPDRRPDVGGTNFVTCKIWGRCAAGSKGMDEWPRIHFEGSPHDCIRRDVNARRACCRYSDAGCAAHNFRKVIVNGAVR